MGFKLTITDSFLTLADNCDPETHESETMNNVEDFSSIDMTGVGDVAIDIGDDFEKNESCAEKIGKKLRGLQTQLAEKIRQIKSSVYDDFKKLAILTNTFADEWGNDAQIIAGIVLVILKIAKKPLRELIRTVKVTLGPVAQVFWKS